MTTAPTCYECGQRNDPSAKFCRHCGEALARSTPQLEPTAHEALVMDDLLASDGTSLPALDEQRLFRELCWLCGAPIAISVGYTIRVRMGGASALVDLLAVGAIGAVAAVGGLLNPRLVLGAIRLPKARRDLAATLLVAAVAWPVLTGAFWLLERLGFLLYSDYLTAYVLEGWPIWVGYADVALLTPIAEELLFRGVIQPKLGQILTQKEALIVQAALFSALHLSPIILVTHFAMGLAFGWLRLYSGSLLPGMLLHGAWNAWVVWSAQA